MIKEPPAFDEAISASMAARSAAADSGEVLVTGGALDGRGAPDLQALTCAARDKVCLQQELGLENRSRARREASPRSSGTLFCT